MNEMDLKEIGRVDPSEHWYYQSKAFCLTNEITRHANQVANVLDVGAGSGFFSKHLIAEGLSESAVCIDPDYTNEQLGSRDGLLFVKSASSDQGSTTDLVLMMDVLEHVDDDIGLLQAYRDLVPPGTLFLISVPAFQFMWSNHDVFLEHRRRYTRRELELIINAAGLKLLRARYIFGTFLPIAYMARKFGQQRAVGSTLKQGNPIAGKGLAAVSRIEESCVTNLIGGLTVLAAARTRT